MKSATIFAHIIAIVTCLSTIREGLAAEEFDEYQSLKRKVIKALMETVEDYDYTYETDDYSGIYYALNNCSTVTEDDFYYEDYAQPKDSEIHDDYYGKIDSQYEKKVIRNEKIEFSESTKNYDHKHSGEKEPRSTKHSDNYHGRIKHKTISERSARNRKEVPEPTEDNEYHHSEEREELDSEDNDSDSCNGTQVPGKDCRKSENPTATERYVNENQISEDYDYDYEYYHEFVSYDREGAEKVRFVKVMNANATNIMPSAKTFVI